MAWLAGYEQVLREMPGDEFESYKTGLINKRLEKLKNLGQETGRFWHHVTSEVFDFELGKSRGGVVGSRMMLTSLVSAP